MNIFRNKWAKGIFSIGTFIVLMNLCCSPLAFNFLIKNSSLKNNTTLRNLLTLVYEMSEEEKDSEETKEVNETKELDLFYTFNHAENERAFSNNMKEYHDFEDKLPLSGNLQTVTQPPEFIS